MNHRVKTVLLVGLSVLIVMALFPPWSRCELRWIDQPNSNGHEGAIYTHDAGYGFVLTPPTVGHPLDSGVRYNASCIDLTRLLIQWMIVAAITTGLAIARSNKEPRTESVPQSPDPSDP